MGYNHFARNALIRHMVVNVKLYASATKIYVIMQQVVPNSIWTQVKFVTYLRFFIRFLKMYPRVNVYNFYF